MNEKQRAKVKRVWEKQDDTHQMESFWQDHFYSSDRRFGYPVCVQLVNTETKQVEDNAILDWRTSGPSCEALLEQVEAYIVELNNQKAIQP